MAFATGHKPPANFVAGQLKDGASVGSISSANFGGQPTDFNIVARWYKNKLVALVGRSKPDGTVMSQPVIVQRQYILNLVDLAINNDIPFLKSFAALVADDAGLASVGLVTTQNVPTNPTGELIPFEMTADGIVKAYTSPVDAAKATQVTAEKTQQILTQIANNGAVGNNALPGGTGAGNTGTPPATGWAGLSMTTKVIVGVVVAVVIGGIVYMVVQKPKKGGRR